MSEERAESGQREMSVARLRSRQKYREHRQEAAIRGSWWRTISHAPGGEVGG